MVKTPLKRKTPLRARAPFKRHTKPKVKRKKSDLQKLKARLWTLCREVTRKRYGNTCFTCGKTGLEGSNWQTGHFVSSSICSTALRYDLKNLRPQCYNCNINKSGNWIAFEYNLQRDGVDVQELKSENERTKGLMYREDWYMSKIVEYETYG